jgi:hypothetical protein
MNDERKPSLDSISGCVEELSSLNVEVAEFGHEWATAAGELKRKEKLYERLWRAAMRGTEGRNADERSATAAAAVESIEGGEGLAESIEDLTGRVETFKVRFKGIERRAGNVQSILAMYRIDRDLQKYSPQGSGPQ